MFPNKLTSLWRELNVVSSAVEIFNTNISLLLLLYLVVVVMKRYVRMEKVLFRQVSLIFIIGFTAVFKCRLT